MDADPATTVARSPDGRHAARLERLIEVRMGSPRFGWLAVEELLAADVAGPVPRS